MNGPARRTNVALVVNVDQPEAAPLARRARAWWEAHGYDVEEIDDVWNAPDDDAAFFCAVSLGGDGTMLRTIHFAMRRRVPVIGVNLGSFGYLTQVEPDQMETAFGQFVDGDVAIDERMVLDVRVERASGASERHLAVNEAAIERNAVGRTLRINLAISKRPFLSYLSDGVLVATPTGSTAYNLSLRGPIVSPQLAALIVTPISPHMLFDRSLVLDPGESVRLEVGEGPPLAVVVVDGLAKGPIGSGDAVIVECAEETAQIVRFAAPDFHAILREKFGLADR
ncbi:MAG: NAD(+)/NADH kinase [Acidimicrobiales bacterium]